MNKVIQVDEGSENFTGIFIGQPTVESLIEGILIVGADTRESLEATTVIVTGKIFLKLV